MVAAGHRLSARAGAEALARGGGAVDAVCAAAFAAAVAESPLTGPGAGGFLLVRSPSGDTALMDFFVAAPGLGPRGRPLDPADLDHFTVPFGGAEQVFHIGPASVAVPGMVAGLGEAVRRFGRLPLSEVVAPAVGLAREGVVLTRETGYLHEILADMLTATPAAAAVYAPGGRLLGPGDRVRLPDLAETLAAPGRGRAGEHARRAPGLRARGLHGGVRRVRDRRRPARLPGDRPRAAHDQLPRHDGPHQPAALVGRRPDRGGPGGDGGGARARHARPTTTGP